MRRATAVVPYAALGLALQEPGELLKVVRTRRGKKTALFIRHAARARFTVGMSNADMDRVPITESGRGEALLFGQDLVEAAGCLPVVFTSPIHRCRQTAAALVQYVHSGTMLSLLATIDQLVPEMLTTHFASAAKALPSGIWVYVTHDRVVSLLAEAAAGRVPDPETTHPVPFLGGIAFAPT